MSEGDPRHAPTDAPSEPPEARVPRPSRVRIDPAVCAGFGTCLALAPAAFAEGASRMVPKNRSAPRAPSIPANGPVLDAMAACPTGAIRWIEPHAPNESRASRDLDEPRVPPGPDQPRP